MENFEKYIKDQVDGYRINPKSQTWKRINNSIHGKQSIAFATVLCLMILGIIATAVKPTNTTNTLQVYTPQLPFVGNASGVTSNVNSTSNLATNQVKNKPNSAKSTIRSIKNTNPTKRATLVTIADDKYISTFTSGSKANKLNNATSKLTTANAAVVSNTSNQSNIAASEQPYTVMEKPITSTQFALEASVPEIPTGNKYELEAITPNPVNATALFVNEGSINHYEHIAASNNVLNNSIIFLHVSKKNKPIKQYYIAPSISYRILTDGRNYKANNNTTSGNSLNRVVTHRPSLGLEGGMNWVFVKSKNFAVKTGFQINYNRYNIRAASTTAELTSINLYGTGNSISTVSDLRNANSFYPKWIENTNLQVSVPIAIQYKTTNNSKANLVIGGGIQPSLLLKNKHYLLTTDLKNYANAPALLRRLNMNVNIETLLSITGKKSTVQFGPQLRLQALSSYKGGYPIKENLLDYGFKFAVSNPF